MCLCAHVYVGKCGYIWMMNDTYSSFSSLLHSDQAVDTTGAGDAFVAGLLHKLCQDPSLLTDATSGANGVDDRLRAVMAFACGCGALVCQGAGAIDPQPTAAEAVAFVEARGG
jgi:sugar/nucleoside kinase (ribokinase family)